jgi:nucleotide-binding universal stress UspA family protein
MNKILLAYDGSDPSKRAAAKTGELAARLGVPVTVVTVGELAPSAYGTVAPVVDPERSHPPHPRGRGPHGGRGGRGGAG